MNGKGAGASFFGEYIQSGIRHGMKKEWFFDRYCGQQFVALLEDGVLAEFAAEKESGGEIVGNIYKGRVANVLGDMQAAFVSCGLERNCYLSTEESYTDYTKYDGTMGGTNAKPLDLKPGDEILVQVVQPPRGSKGAKVTTHLSFVGKNLIYLPRTDFIGISRKITEEELRKNLLFTAERMRTRPDEGFVVRTQAPYATRRQLRREAEYLKNLWRVTAEAAERAPVGSVLHKECDLPVRIMRDSMGDDVTAMHVGDRELYERLLGLVRLRGDFSERKVTLYAGKRAMFREYGISPLVYEAAQPRVQLKSGGSLVIDHTEAMTVVDVNSGKFVGDKNMEQTALEVNLEAAREIARQVRLRNIGGIVAVDFIDMDEESHREKVTAELSDRLSADKAKCRVLPMSEFCVSQFTRKRVGSDVLSYLLKPCEHCGGRGYVHADVFVVAHIRADLLDLFADGYTAAVVELGEGIMRRILDEGLLRREAAGRWKDKQVYLIPHRTYADGQYSVRGDNSGVLHLPDNAQILY